MLWCVQTRAAPPIAASVVQAEMLEMGDLEARQRREVQSLIDRAPAHTYPNPCAKLHWSPPALYVLGSAAQIPTVMVSLVSEALDFLADSTPSP